MVLLFSREAAIQGRRIAKTPLGLLNSIELENIWSWINLLRKSCQGLGSYAVPVIVNIVGSSVEEYTELAGILDKTGISAIELNISCSNVKKGCMLFGTDEASAAEVVEAVKNRTGLPVIVKISPNITDIVNMAKVVEAAGADVILLINTLLGMAIDLHSRRPVLGNIVGGHGPRTCQSNRWLCACGRQVIGAVAVGTAPELY